MHTHVGVKQTMQASFPEGGVFYYWPRGFFLLAPSFTVDRGDHPTRRPSIRLMLSLLAPFEIELSNGSQLKTRALLMSADVRSRQIIANACSFVLLDMAVSTPEYATLAPLVEEQGILALEPERFVALLPHFEQAFSGKMSGDQIRGLRRETVYAIARQYPQTPDYDPRVEAALGVIEQHRLEDVSLESIAEAVHLSPDRLRHLFKEQVGLTVSHFARTTAVWKALSAWSQGQQLTHLAHEVGFHDSSHFSNAVREMFGFSPVLATSARHFKVIGSR